METWHVAAALLSALLHAGWNAAVKASPNPNEAMIAQMVVSALLMVPLLFWLGLPAPASWPWIAASTAMNVVTVAALLRAYTMAGYGVVYPVVRALCVLIVVPLTHLTAGETVSPWGLLGIALIALSLVVLATGGPVRGSAEAHPVPAAAFGWMALAGITTALYVTADANGTRAAGDPTSYGALVSITNALAVVSVRRIDRPVQHVVRDHWRSALPTAIAAVASYWLILWVWSVAPVAPSAALRDTSAVFAILISVVWLAEPIGRRQVAALMLAAAAIPLLRLA